jgi:hypothetical protein
MTLASLYRGAKDVSILPVVIPELELGNVESAGRQPLCDS